MDALKYDNAKALRDENATFVTAAAEKAGVVLVEESDYKALKETAEVNEETIKADREKVLAIATNAQKSKHEAEVKDLQHKSEMEISKLTVEKDMAIARIEGLMSDNAKLQEQVAKIPEMIEKAVAAANANVVVTQDAGKK